LKKKITSFLASLLVGAMLIGYGTSAIYTSQAENIGNIFTSGTLTISLDKDSLQGEHYFEIENMAPGDSEVNYITVSNDGTLDLRFDIAGNFDAQAGTLGEKLVVSYYKHDGVDNSGNDIWTPIAHARNANLELGSGDSVDIKIEIDLPLETNNDYQGAKALLNFVVNAEQTKNYALNANEVNFMNTINIADYTHSSLPFNTYYEDQRYQYIIYKDELEALGFTAGTTLTKIAFKSGITPPDANLGLNNFTVRMKNTTLNTLTNWEEDLTTVHQSNIATSNWATNTWYEFALSGFVWDGENLIVDVIRDNNAWANHGSMWVTQVSGENRVLNFYSDSNYAYPYTGVPASSLSYVLHTKLFGN
jgi:hypothetical protein